MHRLCAANTDDSSIMETCEASEASEADYRNKGYPNTVVKCFICQSDGCNGAAQYGPVVVLIALPVAIAKIFVF